MSSQGQGNNPSGQKSPGKGGKSLQLMQQRMQAQSNELPPAPQQEEEQQPQQGQLESTQQQSNSHPPSSPQNSPTSRPKGKDFAAMSARNHRPSDSDPAFEAAPSQMPQQGSRPKGKDFSALSNRMGNQQQQQQPQTMTQEQQQLRAAQMQNAARAAAGLPPLANPTATSVTTTPPSIPTPRNLGQSNVNPATSASSLTSRMHAPTTAAQPVPSAAHYQQQQQQQQQQLQRQQQMQQQQQQQQREHQQAMQRQQQMQQAAAGSHATSSVSNAAAATRAPVPAPVAQATQISSYHQPQPTLSRPAVQSKGEPSPAPIIEEGHLSHLAGPHIVPAVGERIQTLLNSIDPNYTLDSAAEAQVLQLANDFLTKVTQQSFELAQHRGSPALDVQDVQWVLAKQWGIVIPGLGPPPTRSLNPTANSAAKRKRRASGSSTGSASKPKTPNAKTQAVSAAASSAK